MLVTVPEPTCPQSTRSPLGTRVDLRKPVNVDCTAPPLAFLTIPPAYGIVGLNPYNGAAASAGPAAAAADDDDD